MVGWNASHAHTYMNNSLCGSAEIADFASNGESTGAAGELARDSLLIGAWRGAPDGTGTDQRGGYYNGLIDNLEVSNSAYLPTHTGKCEQYKRYPRPHITTISFVVICHPPKYILTLQSLQVWSSLAMYGKRNPRVSATGDEFGLLGLWMFNEGRGTVTVDSASWRSPDGVARFGVLTPAVAVASPATDILASMAEGSDSLFDTAGAGLQRPSAPVMAWTVSTAPEGGLVRSFDTRPFFLRVNGTDAHSRPLISIFTRVPAGGTLSVVASASGAPALHADRDAERVLGVGDAVPVGTRLVYKPASGAHDPWPDDGTDVTWEGGDWTMEAAPYDWLAYRVETEGGEISANEAVVALSVRPEDCAWRLRWPSKVRNLSGLFNVETGSYRCL